MRRRTPPTGPPVAELTTSERLQPSLLDRLTDQVPERSVESRDQRVLSTRQLRAAVLRDLAWLLNANSKDNTDEYEDYPMVAASVLNFGMPDLSGLSASAISPRELERLVKRTIERFEPRILKGSLRIKVITAGDSRGFNAIGVEISGDLWGQPIPEPMFIKTSVDLETGQCTLTEERHG